MNPKSLLFGLAVGDALGVPVEFKPRSWLKEHPVTGMQGYGTHKQPPGTWSDDSSLTFCLAEALIIDDPIYSTASKFQRWYTDGYWTPHGEVFDIGNTTSRAIYRIIMGHHPTGLIDVDSNGNGSLMRIAPLLFYVMDKPVEERWEITKQVSSITHGHIRSVIACFYYLEFLRWIIKGSHANEIYFYLQDVGGYLNQFSVSSSEINHFDRLLNGNIGGLPESEVKSTGYVLHTLEASIWCLLTTDNYRDAVLKAVNLGHDSDTTGAVTGALAGLLYGYEAIPQEWINQLARREDIEDLAERVVAVEELDINLD